MDLASEYRRQAAFRDWSAVFEALPSLEGQTVLDLGCGVGNQAAELAARGARVIGVDLDEDLLREARSRRIPGAEFRSADLRAFPDLGVTVDGIWSSFAVAYLPDVPAALAAWRRHLRQGGWIALIEIDHLFGHEPLAAPTRSLLEAYAQDALAAGRYDFHAGSRLRGYLEQSGFAVTKAMMLPDRELSFDGPAAPDVVDAWRARLDRMQGLQDFCGAEFADVRTDFLAGLTNAAHRATAKVVCCIATT